MAITEVQTTDTVNTFRTKVNQIATQMGDIAGITVSDGSSVATTLVDAVNMLQTQVQLL